MNLQDSPKMRGLREKLAAELAQKGIRNPELLRAFLRVPRHLFVESALAEQAYKDIALPILNEQTISQPYTVAYQTRELEVRAGDKVLEIGCGSGYQAAILCELGADVYSIERVPVLYDLAKNLLGELGYRVEIRCGDGTLGWPEEAPFDRIIVTAGSPGVPETLKKQLKVGGKMVIPVGGEAGQQMLVVERGENDEYNVVRKKYFKFVPLIGREGWRE